MKNEKQIVYILLGKRLVNSSRMRKMATSLQKTGYEVVLIVREQALPEFTEEVTYKIVQISNKKTGRGKQSSRAGIKRLKVLKLKYFQLLQKNYNAQITQLKASILKFLQPIEHQDTTQLSIKQKIKLLVLKLMKQIIRTIRLMKLTVRHAVRVSRSAIRLTIRIVKWIRRKFRQKFKYSPGRIIHHLLHGKLIRHITPHFPYLSIRGAPGYSTLFSKMVKRYLLEQPPGIYFAHESVLVSAALSACKKNNSILIHDIVELITKRNLQSRAGIIKKWFISTNERFYCRQANIVTTVSESIKHRLTKAHAINNVIVIRNFSRYQSKPAPCFETLENIWGADTLRNLEQKKKIMYSGALHPHRGIEQLIAAMGHLSDEYVLLLVCPIRNNITFLNKICKQITEDKVKNKVYLLPGVDADQVVSMTAYADLSMVPFQYPIAKKISQCYTIPNKIGEAVMARVPVCAPPYEPIKPLYEKHEIGQLLYSIQPEKLALTIKEVCTLSEKKYYVDSLERAAQEYHWENEVDKFVSALKNITQNQTYHFTRQ